MKKFSALILGVLATAPLFAVTAPAPEYAFRESKDLSSVEIASENDLFGVLGGDKDYTNGFKLAYVTPSLNDDPAVWNYRAHFGLVQEMYTPQNKAVSFPVNGDRPYSAWLYGMAGLGWEDENTLDLLTLRAGIVGPSALGETIQNNYHKLIDAPHVNGWGSQLRDEPGVDLSWNRTWRARVSGDGTGFGSDLLPRLGYEVGTVRHFGAVGLQWRFGKNLPSDFGVKSVRDGGVDGAPVKLKDGSGLAPDAYYGFVDLQGEGWIWNMTLDGNMYHKSYGVPRNEFVAQGGFGVAAYWGGVKVTISEFFRTEEYRGQNGVFCFGSLSLGVAF